jgi:hypothetical protein
MQIISINPTVLAQIGMGTLKLLILDHSPDIVKGPLFLTSGQEAMPNTTVTITRVIHQPAHELDDATAVEAGARNAKTLLSTRRQSNSPDTLLTLVWWEKSNREPLPTKK